VFTNIFGTFFHIDTKIELIYQCAFLYTGDCMLDLCLCVLRKEQMKDRQRQENSNFMLRYCEQPIYGLIFVCFSYILSVCMVMLLLCLHT